MCLSWMMIEKELELYVHIPFCVKKCSYCDFLSGPADARTRAAYVDALVREAGQRGDGMKEYCVNTVFVGGGTPSILSGEETARIFRALKRSFRIQEDAEITMEVNPGTVTKEKASIWKECGVNRLSIGLQSVDNRELRQLGRIHTYEDFLQTWRMLRAEGYHNMNIDLISAVPGQTLSGWEHTLTTVAELEPEHISAYSLIIEEGTPFFDLYGSDRKEDLDVPALPDEDTEREIYKATGRILRAYGYHRYEISNYAKQGYECRHNRGYWERKEYLGLGLGAASLFGECRFSNPTEMKVYLDHPKNPVRQPVEKLSEEDQMEEFMFLGLRLTDGISCEVFREKFQKSIDHVYGKQLAELEKKGLLVRKNGRICLTERGIDVSNYVFSEFLF